MPIYAYKCESCGHSKDVLQKMSDSPLVDCPSCGAPAFKKQLTAAGFQLKGSGWYVTDFRDGKNDSKSGGDKAKDSEKSRDSKESGNAEKADSSASSTSGSNSDVTPGNAGSAGSGGSAKPAGSTPAPAAPTVTSSPTPAAKAAT